MEIIKNIPISFYSFIIGLCISIVLMYIKRLKLRIDYLESYNKDLLDRLEEYHKDKKYDEFL